MALSKYCPKLITSDDLGIGQQDNRHILDSSVLLSALILLVWFVDRI